MAYQNLPVVCYLLIYIHTYTFLCYVRIDLYMYCRYTICIIIYNIFIIHICNYLYMHKNIWKNSQDTCG